MPRSTADQRLVRAGTHVVVAQSELAELRAAAADASVVREGATASLRRMGDLVRNSHVLTPWMLAYAEWLTCECLRPPTVTGRLAKINSLARRQISGTQLRVLEARLDFQAYQHELERGPLERARAKFIAAFPEYIDAHREALGLARDAQDYRAMAQIAEPVLDRVVPKRSDAVAATQVNITLTPEQVRRVAVYEAPPVLVTETTPPAPASEATP